MGAHKERVERAPMTGSSEGKLLLAGPVNRRKGRTRIYPGFPEAATYLRNAFVTVLDPSDTMLTATQAVPYREHMEHSLALLADADGVVTLPRWEGSTMATVIVSLAHSYRLPIFHLDTHGGLEVSQWGEQSSTWDWLPRPPERRRIL